MNLPVVDPHKPIADGFCFSETYGLSDTGATKMAGTGKVFVTEFRGVCEGRTSNFTGSLIADDLEGARREASRRGLGETVLGVLHSVC